MDPLFLAAIAGLVGSIVTVGGSYLVARRKTSGTVSSSEAETLWGESRALLDRYKVDLAEARSRVDALSLKIDGLLAMTDTLRTDLLDCQKAATVSANLAARAADRLREMGISE